MNSKNNIIVILSIIIIINTAFSSNAIRDGNEDTSLKPNNMQDKEVLLISKKVQQNTINEDYIRQLTKEGVDILERYDAFVLASVNLVEKHWLKENGFEYIELPDRTIIRHGSYVFDTQLGEPTLPSNLRIESYIPGEEGCYILQFIGPIKQDWIKIIKNFDIAFYDYISNFAYIVKMKPNLIDDIRELFFIQWVGIYHPAYKISPEFRSYGSQRVNILTFPNENLNTIIEHIEKIDGNIIGFSETHFGGFIISNISMINVYKIAKLKSVLWIEPGGSVVSPINNQARWIIQSGAQWEYPIHDKGIQGKTQLINIIDSGIYYDHEAFVDPSQSVICNIPNPNHRKVFLHYYVILPSLPGETFGNCIDDLWKGHGTHVSGSAAGDSTDPSGGGGTNWGTYNAYDGMAFESKLIVGDITGGSEDWVPHEVYQIAYDYGAKISSNSWTEKPYTEFYTGTAWALDHFLWDNKDLTMLRSMGNEDNRIPRMSREAVAKNVISVGASQNARSPYNEENMYDMSSRGPTEDIRLKPTVIAPGQLIKSAKVDTISEYWDKWGTSMATPITAGAAALIREYFTEGWYPTGYSSSENAFMPSSALIKAMLINGAVEIMGDGAHDHPYNGMGYPNVDQGWGRINLDNSMYFGEDSDRNLYVIDESEGFNTGEYTEYQIPVIDDSKPLEITLVWTDHAATPGCEPSCIRNNLNLKAIDPNGDEFKGNIYFNDPLLNQWHSEPNPTAPYDSLNVEENILRNSPSKGIWTIRITAENVPYSPQSYALVVTGSLLIPNEYSRLSDIDILPPGDDTRLTDALGDSKEASIVVDSFNKNHIVWSDNRNGDYEIYYSQLNNDGSPGPVFDYRLTTAPGDSIEPSTVIDANDIVHIVWSDGRNGDYEIYYSQLNNDGSPGPVFDYRLTTAPGDSIEPSIAIDSNNKIHVVWSDNRDGFYELFYEQLRPDGTPIVDDLKLTDFWGWNLESRSPSIAIDSSDYIHITWIKAESGIYYTKLYNNGNNLLDDTQIFWGPTVFSPDIIVDIVDNVHIAWIATTRNICNYPFEDCYDWVYYTELDNNGNTLIDDIKVVEQNSYEVGWVGWDLSLVVDATNKILLTWEDSRYGNFEIFFSKIDNYLYEFTSLGERGLTFADGLSIRPSFAVDSNNDIHIVWDDEREGNHEIYYKKLFNLDAKYPQLEIDTNNHVHTVWSDNSDGNFDIHYTKILNDGTLAIEHKKLTDYWGSFLESKYQSIDTDSNGYIHMTWIKEEDFVGSLLYYMKYDNNGDPVWPDEIQIDSVMWFFSYPSIAVDSNDHIHIVWWDTNALICNAPYEECYDYIFYTKLDNNGNTLVDVKIIVIESSGVGHIQPHISILADSTADIHITWSDSRNGNQEIYYTKLDNEGNMYPSVGEKRITYASGDSTRPSINIDYTDDENIHVAWEDDRVGNQEIYYTKLDNEGNMYPSVGEKRITDALGDSLRPSIAVDYDDNIHVTWDDDRGGTVEIYYKKMGNNGNTLFDDSMLTDAVGASIEPDIGIDSNNNIHITWRDDRYGNFQIFYRFPFYIE